MRSLKINRLLPIYISTLPLKFGVDIQSQSKVSLETKKSNMVARRPFWKWHRWKSIGFCLWPPSICIWNLKLKFQSKLDLCSGNHVVYRQTDGQTDRRTDKVKPVYPPPSNFVGRGYNKRCHIEAETKKVAILQSIFSNITSSTKIQTSLKFIPGEPNNNKFRVGLGNGLATSRRQAITFT